MNKHIYAQCHRYVRGNDSIEYPGDDNLRAYWRSRGSANDREGFAWTISPGWVNRTRRLQWAQRQLVVALLGANFDSKQKRPLEPGDTVTTHSTNISMGGAVEYPAVVLDVYPATERALIQVWRFDHIGWERIGVYLDHLERADHDIGYCLDCGSYDWYANFDDDGLCARCAPEPATVAVGSAAWFDNLSESEQRAEVARMRADDRWADR